MLTTGFKTPSQESLPLITFLLGWSARWPILSRLLARCARQFLPSMAPTTACCWGCRCPPFVCLNNHWTLTLGSLVWTYPGQHAWGKLQVLNIRKLNWLCLHLGRGVIILNTVQCSLCVQSVYHFPLPPPSYSELMCALQICSHRSAFFSNQVKT